MQGATFLSESHKTQEASKNQHFCRELFWIDWPFFSSTINSIDDLCSPVLAPFPFRACGFCTVQKRHRATTTAWSRYAQVNQRSQGSVSRHAQAKFLIQNRLSMFCLMMKKINSFSRSMQQEEKRVLLSLCGKGRSCSTREKENRYIFAGRRRPRSKIKNGKEKNNRKSKKRQKRKVEHKKQCKRHCGCNIPSHMVSSTWLPFLGELGDHDPLENKVSRTWCVTLMKQTQAYASNPCRVKPLKCEKNDRPKAMNFLCKCLCFR